MQGQKLEVSLVSHQNKTEIFLEHGLLSNSEIDEYIREPCFDMEENPLEYWKINKEKYPKLATLSLCEKYMSVPATSAPVERLFSIAGKVFHPDRSRLSDKVFEQHMFIKCNRDLC